MENTPGTPKQTKTNKASKQHKTRKKRVKLGRRYRIVIALTVIALFFFTLINMGYQTIVSYADEAASLSNSLSAATSRGESVDAILDEYDSFDDSFNDSYLDAIRLHIARNGHGQESMQQLSNLMGDSGECYYLDSAGVIYRASGSEKLELSDEAMETLRTTGYYTEDGNYYYSKSCKDDGLIVIVWYGDSVYESISGNDALAACQDDAVLVDTATGEVLETQEKSGISVGDKLQFYDAKLSNRFDEDFFYTFIFSMESNRTQYLGASMDMGDGTTLIVYCSMREFLSGIFNQISYSIILLVLYAVLSIVFSIALVRETEGAVRFFKKLRINKAATHIIALMLFSAVLMLVLSADIDLLNRYSTNNQNAVENLNYMSRAVDNTEELSDTLIAGFENDLVQKASLAAWLLQNDGDLFEEKGADYFARLLKVKELTVFDGHGSSVYTSTSYADYAVSSNTEDSEYNVRRILGDETTQIAMHDSDSDTYIAAVKRRDNSGAVFIRTDDKISEAIRSVVTPEVLIKNADFNNASKALIADSDAGIVYWLDSAESEVETYANSFSEDALKNGFVGFQKLSGASYYINTKKISGYTLISARLQAGIVGEYMFENLFLLLEYAVISVIVLIGIGINLSVANPDPVEESEESNEKSILIMNRTLKKMMWKTVVAAVIALFVTLLLDYFISRHSLLYYLLSNDWDKGLNVFSLTGCWIILLFAIILSRMLKILIGFVSQNLGAGAVTAGHLIISLLQVVVWIGAIMLSLYQVGVNPRTLLASAGLTSVVIGIGAQSTVSDIISGFFLVLEGHVRIGDWVSVNGFRGVVTSLGLRTTKITLMGNTISVNNSSMKDVINLSKEPSRIDIHFQVKYGTDVATIQKLIEDNSARYLADCPKILEAPHFENMFDMAASGLDMHIWCYCEEKNRESVHNHVMRTTYEIMEENNIVIPFTTITIDNGDAEDEGRNGENL